MNKKQSHGKFCEVVGNTHRNKILEYFIEMRELDFGLGDVAIETDLNRATVYNTAELLLKEKMIVPTRKVGNTQLYQLSKEKEEVQLLINLFNEVVNTGARKKVINVSVK